MTPSGSDPIATPATPAAGNAEDAGRPDVEVDELLLSHHGDVEARGRIDFAVNVAVDTPPAFLRDAMTAAVARVAAYPDVSAAAHALAAHLGMDPDRILLTNGAAEAFHLVARARSWRDAVVVHPQFTEPETALRAAGVVPARHVLAPPAFVFYAAECEAAHPEADLIVVGNPTNPTSRLHAVADVLRLRRPGRLVLVDEAFIDVVPREADTAIRHAATGEGLAVVRSLTKTFGLAGVRAGFVVSDPATISRLAAVQPHWAVNTLALAAVHAVCTEEGIAHVAEVSRRVAADRPHLVDGLTALGFEVTGPPAAPFVLARHPDAARLHARLRDVGIAVRRGDTFPGLDDTWIRVAVRDRSTTDVLLDALHDITRVEER